MARKFNILTPLDIVGMNDTWVVINQNLNANPYYFASLVHSKNNIPNSKPQQQSHKLRSKSESKEKSKSSVRFSEDFLLCCDSCNDFGVLQGNNRFWNEIKNDVPNRVWKNIKGLDVTTTKGNEAYVKVIKEMEDRDHEEKISRKAKVIEFKWII